MERRQHRKRENRQAGLKKREAKTDLKENKFFEEDLELNATVGMHIERKKREGEIKKLDERL